MLFGALSLGNGYSNGEEVDEGVENGVPTNCAGGECVGTGCLEEEEEEDEEYDVVRDELEDENGEVFGTDEGLVCESLDIVDEV